MGGRSELTTQANLQTEAEGPTEEDLVAAEGTHVGAEEDEVAIATAAVDLTPGVVDMMVVMDPGTLTAVAGVGATSSLEDPTETVTTNAHLTSYNPSRLKIILPMAEFRKILGATPSSPPEYF